MVRAIQKPCMCVPELTLQKLDWIIFFIFPDTLTETAVDPNKIDVIKAAENWVILQCI
jgi:hypothetical protein